jgi:hypothetical protein
LVLRVLVGIRRCEIWVAGAGKWRNPDTDLPPDFDLRRDVHYEAIRQPRTPRSSSTAFKADWTPH